MRQKQNRDGSRVESSERDESRAETRAEERREQTREESRESRAPAETRRGVQAETRTERLQRRDASRNKDAKRERENTSNDSQMLDLVRRAPTAAVMKHVESDLHEHANGP